MKNTLEFVFAIVLFGGGSAYFIITDRKMAFVEIPVIVLIAGLEVLFQVHNRTSRLLIAGFTGFDVCFLVVAALALKRRGELHFGRRLGEQSRKGNKYGNGRRRR